MDMFDPTNCSPDVVATTCTIQEISDVAQAIDPWTRAHAECFDMIFRTVLLRAVQDRRVDEANLIALSSLLGLAAHPRRRRQIESLHGSYLPRWQLLHDLLAEHLARRRERNIERALQVEHGERVLSVLAAAGGSMGQSEVIRELGLGSRSNGTRVITHLVACGAVDSARIGRRNELTLTEEGRALLERAGEPRGPRALRSEAFRRVERFEMESAQLRLLASEQLPFERFHASVVAAAHQIGKPIEDLQTEAHTVSQHLQECVDSYRGISRRIQESTSAIELTSLTNSAAEVLARCRAGLG